MNRSYTEFHGGYTEFHGVTKSKSRLEMTQRSCVNQLQHIEL